MAFTRVRQRAPSQSQRGVGVGSAAPTLVVHVAGAKPARAGPLPGPARSPAAGPRRRVLGRRPPAPGRRSGRRRRPRAVRGAPPRPRRGTRALRRPAHALGPLGAASAVSARRRNDARAGPPARGRVELRRPAHGTVAYIRALDGMAARRAAAPPGLLPGCPKAPAADLAKYRCFRGARAAIRDLRAARGVQGMRTSMLRSPVPRMPRETPPIAR